MASPKFRACAFFLCALTLRGQSNETTAASGGVETLSLEQCQQRAIELNHRRKISQFAVALAEAQHRQALSGYWPQIDLKASIQRSDQPLILAVPGINVGVPAQQISVAGGTALATIPANAFGPGFPPATVQLPVSFPGQTVGTPAQTISTGQQNFKLADRDLASGSLGVTWLLVDGGLRKGLREQSSAGVRAMTAEARRTDLEIADSINRLYWSAVLARQLKALGEDTVARVQMTSEMTAAQIESGSGKRSRTELLRTNVFAESVRSMVAELDKNEQLAEAALANAIGMSWTSTVVPLEQRLPKAQIAEGLPALVADAYRFNPEWAELEAGLEAAQAVVKVKRSDYFPKLALKGDLHRFWNGGFDGGLSTAQNRAGWTVGAGVEVPIFNGLLTQGRVSEALARVRQLKETQLLLREGLGLQVKAILIELNSAEQVTKTSTAAMKYATEARELNMKAYESDMAEPDKVVEAQLLAALATAQAQKAEYERLVLYSRLRLTIGHEVGNLLLEPAASPKQ